MTFDDLKNAMSDRADEFDLSKVNFVNTHTPVEVTHKICGHTFWPKPNNLINKHSGCPKCQNRLPITFSEFVNRSNEKHNDKFEYFEESYVNFTTKTNIRCKTCRHDWSVVPYNHATNASGCPNCVKKSFVSKKETEWLDALNVPKEHRNIFLPIPNRRSVNVDAFHDGVVYEFYGTYWYGDPRKYGPEVWNDRCQATMGDLHERTIERKRTLREAGHEVAFVWEMDFDAEMTASIEESD